MVARTCARRAHQLAASIISNGVGPSRLPATTSCRCQLHAISASAVSTAPVRLAASPRYFSITSRQHEPESSLSSVEETQHDSSAKKNTGLLEDVSDAAPTLEYLDSLKPRARHPPREQRNRRDSVSPFSKAYPKTNVEDKQWERTKARIQASFTRVQLVSLARAAKIPGAYSAKVRKDDIIRRIMIHRFSMEDAKERADREKREELEKRSVHIPFRPAELFLLLARGSGKVRQEAGKAQVAILPKAPRKEVDAASDKLGLWVRGKDQGIDRMVQWVESFKQSIQTKEEDVVLSAEATASDASTTESGAAGEVLPAELVQFIAQLSGCFVEASPVENGKVKLSLAYTDERDAQKAVLLLRQYQSQSVAAMQRIGAAAYCDNLDTLRQYSMLPFVPNEPVPWTKQVNDLIYGASSDVSFRVSHVPDLNAFSHLSVTKLSTMKLTSWSENGESSFSEPLQALVQAASPVDAVQEVECSATLGHVLFSSDGLTLADESLSEDQLLSRMQDPLAAPRPGTWPIEHVTDWTRSFRTRFGREASRFVPATLFRSQKNISLDIWLERQGYALIGKGTPESSAEKMVFTYQQPAEGTRKLQVTLARRPSASDVAEGAGRGWAIEGARWVMGAEADLMIPEKSADLRLYAKTFVVLDADSRAAVEEALAAFVDAGAPAKKVASSVEVVDDVAEDDSGDDANELLGGETEVVERFEETAAVEEPSTPSTGTGPKELPPSTLTLPSIGTLALESATRLTTQTYQHRSSLPEFKREQSIAAPITEAEVASAEASGENVEASSETGTATTLTADAEGAATVAPANNAAESNTATETDAEAEPTPQADATPEPNAVEPTADTEAGATLSPWLVREISQDLVTKSTTESLRLTWTIASPTTAPKWASVVEPISALIDRHDMSMR